MPAPAVLREVFLAYRARRGEEDDGFLFEDAGGPLTRLDVLVYRSAELTTFATIGMAAREMPATPGPGGGGRAELHYVRRARLTRAEEHAIAVRLANLAIHPFLTGTPVDWGHMVGLGDDFPVLPGCRAVFLAGPLSPDAVDYVHTREGPVRILNVVPITDAERDLGRGMSPLDFARYLLDKRDLYT
ncbi:suppressor of fused domain protein [Actinoplanes sp. NEAU-A12]|uniref:Suppressor of fused domain protein n=1 Tax=Actinoplanes sandaracinus TaxID=3045177 RepID=A0ABT6X109_9ACTN|nr:suppressor of fused domain protein [Actinoplanes sandaracinus]MDI6105663.1 suppressor of fused domain protein [Actinoplanes sandaracinus]